MHSHAVLIGSQYGTVTVSRYYFRINPISRGIRYSNTGIDPDCRGTRMQRRVHTRVLDYDRRVLRFQVRIITYEMHNNRTLNITKFFFRYNIDKLKLIVFQINYFSNPIANGASIPRTCFIFCSAKLSTISVRVGTSFLTASGDELGISNVVVHKHFDKYLYFNDIALMKVRAFPL